MCLQAAGSLKSKHRERTYNHMKISAINLSLTGRFGVPGIVSASATITGLTANPTYGQTAQDGVGLTAVASDLGGLTVTGYQWRTIESATTLSSIGDLYSGCGCYRPRQPLLRPDPFGRQHDPDTGLCGAVCAAGCWLAGCGQRDARQWHTNGQPGCGLHWI